MHPEFTIQMADQRIAEMRRQAAHERMLRELRSSQPDRSRWRWLRRRLRLRPVLSESGHGIA